MSDLNLALSQLADLFESLGLEYVVMGGIAVRLYGIPRPTYDIAWRRCFSNTDRSPEARF